MFFLLQQFPENFFYEGILTTNNVPVPSNLLEYLPTYFGNICLRFIPVRVFFSNVSYYFPYVTFTCFMLHFTSLYYFTHVTFLSFYVIFYMIFYMLSLCVTFHLFKLFFNAAFFNITCFCTLILYLQISCWWYFTVFFIIIIFFFVTHSVLSQNIFFRFLV